MALRPLRNATITFGLVNIPVRFYTATKSEDIHFNLLHESCGTRVNRKWWCPYHEKIVPSDELIRGYAGSEQSGGRAMDIGRQRTPRRTAAIRRRADSAHDVLRRRSA